MKKNISIEVEFNKDKLRYSILIIWEILLMIGVVIIQYYLRPQKIITHPTGIFLLGTLPSLFGGAAYMALAFVFHKIYAANYTLIKSLGVAFLFSFGGLTLWECIRAVLYPFDWYDVGMCFLGCLISTIFILILYSKNYNKP